MRGEGKKEKRPLIQDAPLLSHALLPTALRVGMEYSSWSQTVGRLKLQNYCPFSAGTRILLSFLLNLLEKCCCENEDTQCFLEVCSLALGPALLVSSVLSSQFPFVGRRIQLRVPRTPDVLCTLQWVGLLWGHGVIQSSLLCCISTCRPVPQKRGDRWGERPRLPVGKELDRIGKRSWGWGEVH